MAKDERAAPKRADLEEKVAKYMDLRSESGSPEKQLAILEWLAALEPALRKKLRYPNGGGSFDPESEMPSVRLSIVLSRFAKEDRLFWAQHDPAAFPWIPNTTYGDAWDPCLRAIEAAKKRWRATKSPSRPDYAEAKRMLKAIWADEQSPYRRDVAQVLAVIALREGQPKQVFAAIGIEQGEIPREHALFAGAAYLALGDLDRAEACYSGSVVNRGYLAELRGDFATADRSYREGLQASWYAVRPYAELRVARLEQRLGKRELERLREGDQVGKIVLQGPADFHAQFPAIAAAVRKSLGISRKPKPLSEAAIDKLRIATNRHGDTKWAPLPESVKTILRHDRNFTLFEDGAPLLEPLWTSSKKVPSVNVEKLVRRAVKHDDSTGLRALWRLPKDVPVWNDAADLPACIGLSSPGDQALFLYVGVPDASGEYPLARFDDQPELWISNASLIHFVLELAKDVVHCTSTFARPLAAAKKRNAKYREGWSKHPDVQAVLETI